MLRLFADGLLNAVKLRICGSSVIKAILREPRFPDSKVMRCSSYGNGDRMHVILNGEPLEEVDGFKYLGSQVAADGG